VRRSIAVHIEHKLGIKLVQELVMNTGPNLLAFCDSSEWLTQDHIEGLKLLKSTKDVWGWVCGAKLGTNEYPGVSDPVGTQAVDDAILDLFERVSQM
jgi:hypothetical protein